MANDSSMSLRPGHRVALILGLCLLGGVGCGDYGGGAPTANAGPTGFNSVPSGLSRSEQVMAFTASVHPVVTTYCANGCHDTGVRGAPFLFANPNPERAYTVITESQKVNLSSPAQSRIVRRPAAEFHECGTQCVEIGATILMAVEAWASVVETAAASEGSEVAVEGILSREVAYEDGVELEGGERHTGNLIAFWDFKEDAGEVAMDKSSISPAMDLELRGDAEWMSSYGVDLAEGSVRAGVDASRKLYDAIAKPGYGTGQYSVELWINNENITQEDVRIVTYSRGGGSRNFSLEQQGYQYEARNRSLAPGSGTDGRQALITYDVDQDAQETLQHVVLTYDPSVGRRIYVDGRFTDDLDELGGGRLWSWDDTFRLTFGAKSNEQANWRGKLRMAAIYKQALTPGQVELNYSAGVGKRLRLTFSVNDWTGDDTEVQFNVQELDEYSYLFCQPTFVGSNLGGLRLKNMRIAVNPGETQAPPAEGQAFSNLDQILSGQEAQVSRQCSVIAQGDGPESDTFAVVFEELGRFEDPLDESVFEFEIDETALVRPPLSGMRSFDRISATMAALTGVDPTLASIAPVFDGIREQLPSTTDTRSFVSSHQVAVTKLAFEYCHEMVEQPNLRQAAFGSEFESGAAPFFQSDVATAYGDPVLTALMTQRLTGHLLGSEELTVQPALASVIGDLDQLLLELVADCPDCDEVQTMSIAKGLCTALLASAPVMVH